MLFTLVSCSCNSRNSCSHFVWFQVNEKSAGKTSLQVACHQGFRDTVSRLITHGADLEMKDDEGDTALHYAVFGLVAITKSRLKLVTIVLHVRKILSFTFGSNQPNVVRLLLDSGASCDPVNKSGCTPLHVGVSKSHVACVKHLLSANCDVNIFVSNTALLALSCSAK